MNVEEVGLECFLKGVALFEEMCGFPNEGVSNVCCQWSDLCDTKGAVGLRREAVMVEINAI